jgi:hypothetical protein
LLRRALEIDVTDPEAVREFAPVPELRELVATVVTEKAHVRDLSDRLESMRGEIDAMTAGMRRSVEQLDRLREENMSVVGNQIAVLWNSLVERVRFAEEQRALATAKAAVDVGAGAVEDGDLGTLVNRLDELESELGRLRSAVAPPATMFGKREVPVESVHVPQAPSRWRGPAAAADSTPAAPLRTPARDIFFEEEEPAEPATVSTPAGTSSLPVSDFGADDDLPFPHFVGLPVSTPMDRVEVTYEAHGGEEVVDLPASALLFESETDEEENAELEVFDLRSFGAREFEP